LDNADLSGVNLRNAILSNANLGGTNLSGANLSNTHLNHLSLKNTNLKETVLDPRNKTPQLSDEEILSSGFEIDGDFILGWRTRKSQHMGTTIYTPGMVYTALLFSTCTRTDCHPGIYLASSNWLKDVYGSDISYVRVAVCVVR
jgi:uncharacterized protein YjbI with pentapeptide repeats